MAARRRGRSKAAAAPTAAAEAEEAAADRNSVGPVTGLKQVVVERAVRALLAFEETGDGEGSRQLLGGGGGDGRSAVYVQLTLSKHAHRAPQTPVRVELPHSLFSEVDGDSLCLFVRTEDVARVTSALAESGNGGEGSASGPVEVWSMGRVRKELGRFAARKELANAHTHFACDAALVPFLYNSLGQTFLDAKKHPVPIKIRQRFDRVPELVKRAQDSTYMILRGGACVSFRVAMTDMPAEAIVENLLEGLRSASLRLPGGGWANVQSVHIKTALSAAIPIYSRVPSAILDALAQASAPAASSDEEAPPKRSQKQQAGNKKAGKGKRKQTGRAEAEPEPEPEAEAEAEAEEEQATPQAASAATEEASPAVSRKQKAAKKRKSKSSTTSSTSTTNGSSRASNAAESEPVRKNKRRRQRA